MTARFDILAESPTDFRADVVASIHSFADRIFAEMAERQVAKLTPRRGGRSPGWQPKKARNVKGKSR